MEQTDRFSAPPRAVLEAEAAALMRQPGFDAALRRFCNGLTGFHEAVRGGPIGMPNTARWAVAMLILYLSRVAPAQATSATLIRQCQLGGLCGPAAVKGAIALLLSANFVRHGPPAADARARQLAPTERLRAMVAEGPRRLIGRTKPPHSPNFMSDAMSSLMPQAVSSFMMAFPRSPRGWTAHAAISSCSN
jgi:hypothetical protein